MGNTLVSPAQLSDFPGAPFADALVDAAVAQLRNDAGGWHIAPVITETVTLDHDGGRQLVLPTRKLVAVTEVRDVSGTTPTVLTDYRVDKAAGILERSCWPVGTAVIEVDLEHGYTETPADLLPLVVQRLQTLQVNSALVEQTRGPFTERYRESTEPAGDEERPDPLARYTINIGF